MKNLLLILKTSTTQIKKYQKEKRVFIMALANENAVKYRELTDEIIADVKRRIE